MPTRPGWQAPRPELSALARCGCHSHRRWCQYPRGPVPGVWLDGHRGRNQAHGSSRAGGRVIRCHSAAAPLISIGSSHVQTCTRGGRPGHRHGRGAGGAGRQREPGTASAHLDQRSQSPARRLRAAYADVVRLRPRPGVRRRRRLRERTAERRGLRAQARPRSQDRQPAQVRGRPGLAPGQAVHQRRRARPRPPELAADLLERVERQDVHGPQDAVRRRAEVRRLERHRLRRQRPPLRRRGRRPHSTTTTTARLRRRRTSTRS